MEEHEYLAVALWVAHTYIFDRYAVTPRLAVVSPVRGCGKSTLLDLLDGVCQHGRKYDSVSAPALFRMIEPTRPTLLLDEVDTHNLNSQGTLRAVLNGGHSAWGPDRSIRARYVRPARASRVLDVRARGAGHHWPGHVATAAPAKVRHYPHAQGRR